MPSVEKIAPLTVVARRRIKVGRIEEFEAAMREFITFTLSFEGHRAIHVIRPTVPGSRDYVIISIFADGASRAAYKACAGYKEWMLRLKEFTEGEPIIDEMEGLAGWFALPELPAHTPPPKHKMAVVTLLAVYPLSYCLPLALNPAIGGYHPLIKSLIISGLIVVFLTWLVMPRLTRVFKNWLFH